MPRKSIAPSAIAKKSKIISVGALIRQTLAVYKKNWQKFGTILIIPLTLSAFSSVLFYLGQMFIDSFNAALIVGWILLALILIIASGVLFILASIAQLLLLDDLKQSVQFSNLKQWVQRARPFFWPAVFVSVIYCFFSLLGLIFLIVPGIAIMIYYCFAIYELILGKVGAEESFGASRRLVRGRFWAVLGRSLLGCLLIWLVYLIVMAIFSLIGWALGQIPNFNFGADLGRLLYDIFGIFIGLAVGPLSLIYTYTVYQSLLAVKSK